MRIAILGGRGRLGHAIECRAHGAGHKVWAFSSDQADVRNVVQLRGLFEREPVDAIINCAASHFADEVENHGATSYATTVIGSHSVALIAKQISADLVYISSDFVFDGAKRTPYIESDVTAPVNEYGSQKKLAERQIDHTCRTAYIVRTASLFGGEGKRESFVDKMIRSAREGKNIKVVCDVFMSPTYAPDAAKAIISLLESDRPYGIYHIANKGQASWYELADIIYEYIGSKGRVEPVRSDEVNFHTARRPVYSVLASEKLPEMHTWQSALLAYMKSRGIHWHDQEHNWPDYTTPSGYLPCS